MQIRYLPHPLYVQARDHLEQAMAVLSHEPDAAPLLALLDEAVDIAIELAHLPPTDGAILRLLPSDEGRDEPNDE
ncbi:hypothetical protein [Devosia sp. A369]